MDQPRSPSAYPLPAVVTFDHRGKRHMAQIIRGAERTRATLVSDPRISVVLQSGVSEDQLLSGLKHAM